MRGLGVAVKVLTEVSRLARPARAPAPFATPEQWLLAPERARDRAEREVWAHPQVQAGLEHIRARNRQHASILERLWAHPWVQAALRVYTLMPRAERGRTMPPGPTKGWQVTKLFQELLAWLLSSEKGLEALAQQARLAPELPQPARAERVEAPPPIPPPFSPAKQIIFINAPNL